ncbi:heparinase II/III family protein [Microbacterium sp. NPDC056044]|uniref:heparinase II/III domain-containing protein n=1 Tax=Microbacterium sp. NPDC056044 TaxID=3345690 RepID=UPI0035D5DB17
MTTASATFRGELAAVYERRAGAAFGAAVAGLLASPDEALPVAPSDDRTVWGPGGSADPVAVADVLARADDDLGRPWGVPLATAAARIHDDGDREGWEAIVFERQRRLARAALAAAHHADDPDLGARFLAEVLDGVWLICEQSTWCWPAHDDAFRERGSVLPTVTAPYLDLGAGEAVALLTWIDQLLGARLEARYPGIRSRIRHEARVRVFQPFTERRDWHWIGLDGDVHNWNPWIHGNVITAALRLLDDPSETEERAHIVTLALEGIDRYVTALPADGAIDEGYAYWWNGACRALEALDIVRHATGGVLDASGIPALRETVAFPHRMHLGGDWYLNLADGQARVSAAQPWHALHRAARNTGDVDAAAHAASHRIVGEPAATEHEGFGRLLRGITDPAWVGAARASSPFPRDVWLPSTEVLLAREHGGTPRGLTVAVKGGHNGEHHNHNDVGSFVVASDGVPVIVDAGRPTYTLQTFGPGRYDIWTMQSGWHNVPVIGGLEQSPGAEYAASEVEVDGASLSLELAGAYADAAPWHRTVRLERAARRVVIEDAWNPGGTTAPTQVRMLLAGDVHRGAASITVIPLDGATPLRISWPEGVDASLVVRELDDPVLSSVWGARLTRLDLDVTAADAVAVTVELDLTNAEDAR